MILRRFALAFAPALLVVPHAVGAQQKPAPVAPSVPTASPTGWHTGSDIPLHPAFVTGTLANGLRYAVRRNAEPQGRLSIRVHLKVGALMEEDQEQGWAHLVEHMLFRGTKAFPDGEGEKMWQRLGARPGSHSNAFTSFTSTRYVLDISRADAEATDQALTILADMMANASFDKALLEKEQQIVLAERAMRTSEAESRIQTQRLHFYQPDHRAGARNIIGTVDTLAAAKPKALRHFYERWYRPERATVVIVGDADPAVMVAAIAKAFGGWRGKGVAGVDPVAAPVPTNPSAATIIERHYGDSVELMWQHAPAPRPTRVAQRERDMVDAIAQMVLNARLRNDIESSTEVVRASVDELKNTPLVPRRLSLTLQMAADSTEADTGPAVSRVYRVLNGAMQSVRQDEIDEQARSLMRLYRQHVDREAKAQSKELADGLVASFDPQTILSEPSYSVAMLERLRPTLTPAVVSERLRALFGGRPRILYLSAKAPQSGTSGVENMLADAMRQKPPENSVLAATSLDALQLPALKAKIVARSEIADLGITRLKLSNGVEIALRPNDQLRNQMTIRAKVGRGVIARPPSDPGLYWSTRGLGLAGIGPFDRTALQRLGAGRQIVPQYFNDSDGLILSVTTTREDMADAMKLMVGAITQMRFDDIATKRFQAGLKTGYRNFLSDPSAVMEISGTPLRFGGDTRFRPLPTLTMINRLTPAAFKEFWSQELAQGPVKLSVVGDFDPAIATATATDLFGRLRPKATPAPPADRIAVRASAEDGKPQTTLFHIGDPDRAMAMLVYPTVSADQDLKSARAIQLTTYIVRQRLAEGFRAQQAGTYGANATSLTNRSLPNYGVMMVSSELKPELIPAFEQAVRAIMIDLATNGPSADSFARARTPMLAEIETTRKSNGYWVQILDDSLDDPKIVAAVRTYISGRAALTPQDVQHVAKAYLAGTDGALPNQAFRIDVLPAPPRMVQTSPVLEVNQPGKDKTVKVAPPKPTTPVKTDSETTGGSKR